MRPSLPPSVDLGGGDLDVLRVVAFQILTIGIDERCPIVKPRQRVMGAARVEDVARRHPHTCMDPSNNSTVPVSHCYDGPAGHLVQSIRKEIALPLGESLFEREAKSGRPPVPSAR